MFIKIVCLYVAVVCISGAPPTDVVPLERQSPTVIPIVEQSEELEANGTYKYRCGPCILIQRLNLIWVLL